MKKLLPLLLAAALLLGCAPVHKPTETTEPTLETTPSGSRAEAFGLSYQPEAGMHPYTCTRLSNRPMFSLLYQGLFAVSSQYRAEPVLCKSFRSSQDLRTYEFTLEDATFSDGSPVTANDVVQSLREARGSPMYGDRLRHITDFSVLDDKTLEISLDTPYENLPLLLNIPILPADGLYDESPLGTGPYVLSADGTCLQKRVDWWSDYPPAVKFQKIPLSAAEGPSELRDQFEFGQTDLTCADPGSPVYVEYRCDYELWDCASGIFLYLGCNNAGLFGSQVLRRGLTHIIDRHALAELYQGFAEEACLPASPSSDFYDDTLAANYAYDPALFAEYLQNSGMQGTAATLLVCNENPVRVEAAEWIAKAITDQGMTIFVNAVDRADYVQALEYGNFDLYLGETRLSPNFDLSLFYQDTGTLNFGGIQDADLYSLSLKALENSGNYNLLFSEVMEDAMLCPILFRTYAIYATRGTVTDLLPGLDNAFHTANSRQLEDAQQEPYAAEPEEETEETEEAEADAEWDTDWDSDWDTGEDEG